jgi:hypothetical protein
LGDVVRAVHPVHSAFEWLGLQLAMVQRPVEILEVNKVFGDWFKAEFEILNVSPMLTRI